MQSPAALLSALRAVAEPTRIRLLRLLALEELSVMELVQILGQSQPRLSRHLKLLNDSRLIDRFPDGAWVFYRLATQSPHGALISEILKAYGPPSEDDLKGLEVVRQERRATAEAYFASVATQWDEMRKLHASEAEVDRACLTLLGDNTVGALVDLGTGTGHMIRLLQPLAESVIGLDLSQSMLNVARKACFEAGLTGIEFSHGDINDTRLSAQSADLVIIHQVLHYLSDPSKAILEAARLLRHDGRLLVVDFASHRLESLREQFRHRRLGFSDKDMTGWAEQATLSHMGGFALPPQTAHGLTVKGWLFQKS